MLSRAAPEFTLPLSAVLPVPFTVLIWDAGAGPRAVLRNPGPSLLLIAAGETEPAAVLAEGLLLDASGPDAEEAERGEDWALGAEEPDTPGAAIGTPDMPADNCEPVESMADDWQRK